MPFKLTLEILTDVCKLRGWGWSWLAFDSSLISSERLFFGWSGRGGPKMLLPVNSLALAFEKLPRLAWISSVVSRVPLSSLCFATSGIVTGFFGDALSSPPNDIWLTPPAGWRSQTSHDSEKLDPLVFCVFSWHLVNKYFVPWPDIQLGRFYSLVPSNHMKLA